VNMVTRWLQERSERLRLEAEIAKLPKPPVGSSVEYTQHLLVGAYQAASWCRCVVPAHEPKFHAVDCRYRRLYEDHA
jgi:hypothetical protein